MILFHGQHDLDHRLQDRDRPMPKPKKPKEEKPRPKSLGAILGNPEDRKDWIDK